MTQSPLHFTDRNDELSLLLSIWEEIRSKKKGRFIFIAGDIGIGKTALINEFIRRIKNNEVSIGLGNCVDIAQGNAAYLPFQEALSEIIDQVKGKKVDPRFLSVLEDVAPTWLGIIPVVGDILAAGFDTGVSINKHYLRPKFDLSNSHQQVSIFNEYVKILKTIGEKKNILLVIDDAQWIDPDSINLLYAISRNLNSLNLCLVVLYRFSDVEKDDPLHRLMLEVIRSKTGQYIELNNFTLQDVKSYLDSHFPRNTISAEYVNWLHNWSGGNPLILAAIVDFHVQKGFLHPINEVWSDKKLNSDAIPETVEYTLKTVVDQIDSAGKDVLEKASVQGRSFLVKILSNILQTDELQVEDKLTLLTKSYRIISSPTRTLLPSQRITSRYEFIHTAFQQLIYGELSPAQRSILHQKVAESLEKEFEGFTGRIAETIAYHFDQANLPGRATPYHLLAGSKNLSVYALDVAETHFNEVVKDGNVSRQSLCEAWNGLGSIAFYRGNFDLATGFFTKTIEEKPVPEYLAIEAKRKVSYVSERKGDLAGAKELLKSILAGENPPADQRTALELGAARIQLARIEWRLGNLEAGVRLCNQGLQDLQGSDSYSLISTGYRTLGVIYTSQGGLDEAEKNILQGIELAQKSGDSWELGSAYSNLSHIYRMRGEYDRALEQLQKALSIMKEIGDNFRVATTLENMGQVYLARQEWQESNKMLRRAIRIYGEVGAKQAIPFATSYQAEVLVHLGDLNGAEQLAQMIYNSDTPDKIARGRACLVLAMIRLAAKDNPGFLDFAQKSRALLSEGGDRFELGKIDSLLDSFHQKEKNNG